MSNIPIVLEPKYKIGEIVALKLNPEYKLMICGYRISKISDAGEVLVFCYSLYNENGDGYTYSDEDLISVKEVV